MGWNTVYILIMGSIRSFDGRNCEWLIKYTRAVSVQYVQYSVGTPWPHLDVAFHTVGTLRWRNYGHSPAIVPP